jgi:glyoxylate carboligase
VWCRPPLSSGRVGLQGYSSHRPRPDRDRAHCARQLAREHKVPAVVEIFLERITNIAMGTDIDNITEDNELSTFIDDSPTAALPCD